MIAYLQFSLEIPATSASVNDRAGLHLGRRTRAADYENANPRHSGRQADGSSRPGVKRMASGPTGKSSVSDPQVHAAIWATICLAAEQLPSGCSVYFRPTKKAPRERLQNQAVPKVQTWRLVEALSLLGILLRADAINAATVRLFSAIGPIEIVEDGRPRFLWVQKGLRGDYSDLGGRPDIVVTSSFDPPTAENKARQTTPIIRDAVARADP